MSIKKNLIERINEQIKECNKNKTALIELRNLVLKTIRD